MAVLSQRAVHALVPYVGSTVADTCVRATALTVGKTFDTLADEDIHALSDRVRRLLAPLLPGDAIDRVIADIRGGA